MENSQPHTDDFSGRSARITGERIEKFEMEFGKAEGLHVFTEHVKFFSPALLYLHGRFTDEPLVQFIDEHASDLKLMHHRFANPIFAGFFATNGDRDWNHVLWGVEADKYVALENYVLSATTTDASMQWVARVGVQDIEIADPLHVDLAGGLVTAYTPRIPIAVWGADTNMAAAAVEVPEGPANQIPRLKIHPPQPETLAFAKALFSGSNPAAARAQSLNEQGARDENDT